MNKKCMIKIGSVGIAVIIILSVVSFLIFSGIAIANTIEKGAQIKIDLSDFGDYVVKVKTPNETIIKKSSEKVFIFAPKEEGEYVIEINSGKKSAKYFYLVQDKEAVIKNLSDTFQPYSTENLIDNYSVTEDYSAKNPIKIKENKEKYNVVVGRNVSFKIKVNSSERLVFVSVPREAEDIRLFGKGEFKVKDSFMDKLFKIFRNESDRQIAIKNPSNDTFLEYTLEGPKKEERNLSFNRKEVKVYSKYHYESVLSYTALPKEVKLKSQIKVYWKENNTYLDFDAYDLSGNGLYDYIEWVVPHLSNQTFEIFIEIISAEHLDENFSFISDIYEKVKSLDGNFSEEIGPNEFILISFEKNLTSQNYISLFLNVTKEYPYIELYSFEPFEKISTIENLNNYDFNKIFLDDLSIPQKSFFLKVLNGSISVDYIVDPFAFPSSSVDLRAQTCNRQEDQVSQNVFDLPCAGTYPSSCGSSGDRLSCDDSVTESAQSRRVGTSNRYGGVRVIVYNSSISDCVSIDSVSLCYEFWGASSQHVCNVGVSNNSGSSWVDVSATCTATTNPGITCVNVTSLLNWSCSNFFGSGSQRASAKAQALRNSGNGYQAWNFDVLFFNVSYTPLFVEQTSVNLTNPSDNFVTFQNSINFSFIPTTNVIFMNCSLWDNSTGIWQRAQTNTSQIINGSQNYINKTFANYGSYLWNIECCTNLSCTFSQSNRTLTIQEPPNYLSDFYVQKGTATMTTTTLDIPIEEVNTSRAFILISTRSGTGTSSPSALQVTGEFFNSTILRLTRFSTETIVVEWQVIESSSFFVQTGETSSLATDTALNVNLQVPVNLNNSFIILNSRINTATTANLVRSFWTAEFVNETRFNLTRGVTGTSSQVRWFVVSFSGAKVKRGVSLASITPSTADLQGPVNLNKSFLIFQTRATDTNAQSIMVQGGFVNASRLFFMRSSTTGTTTVSYYVVEHDSFFVNAGNYRTSNSGPQSFDIEKKDYYRSFTLNSYNSEESSTTWSNVFSTNQLTHPNFFELEKYGATSTNNNTWFLIEARNISSTPETPRNFRIYDYENYPKLSWQAPIKKGIATKYTIERALDNSGNPGSFSFLANTTELIYEDLTAEINTRYWYRIKSLNEYGESSYTQPIFFDYSSRPSFSDFYVQRGTATMTTTTLDIPIEEVNTSRAFILLSTMSGTGTGLPSNLLVTGEFFNSTTLRLTKFSTASTVIEWQVIESSSFFVQTGEISSLAADSTISIDLSSPVNVSNSFIILNSRMNSGTTTDMVRSFWTAEFVNSTRFTLTRGVTGTSSQVRWFVVSFSNSSIQRGTSLPSISSRKVYLEKSFNPQRSFLIFQTRATDTNAQSIMVQGDFYDNQTLSFLRSSTIGLTHSSYYLIEHLGLKTQNGNYRSSDAGAIEVPLEDDVKITRTFTTNSYNSEESSTTWSNIYSTNRLYGSSTIELEKYGATSTNNHSFFAVEAVIYNSPPLAPRNLVSTDITKNSVRLIWDEPNRAGIPTEYVIERAPDNSGTPGAYFELDRTSELFYLDDTLTYGLTYWYRVKAVNEYGESAYSNEIEVTPSSGNIPRGTTRMTTTTLNITIPKVDTSKSFVLLSTRADSTTSNPAVMKVTGRLINSTLLRLERHATSPIYVDWEIVESADFFVQSGEVSPSLTTDSVINVNLPTPVNLSSSFIIVHSRIPSTTYSQMVRSFWTAEFVNSTRFTLTRGVIGTNSTVVWYVVNYNNSNVISGTTNATTSPQIVSLPSPVDLSRSFLIFQTRATDTNAQSIMVQGGFVNSSSLFFRRSSTTGTTTVSYYVISSDKLSVQRGNFRTSNPGYQNITINDIGLKRTFNVNSYNTETSTTTWGNVFTTSRLYNSTTLQLNKYGGTATNNHSWFVISFSLPETRIISPVNRTYGINHFPLLVHVNLNEVGDSVKFSYDNWQTNYSLSSTDRLNWYGNITFLESGNYTLRVESEFSGGYKGYKEVNFSVDLTPLLLTINSPMPIRYNISSIDLSVYTNKEAESCNYSLNGAQNVSMNKINSTYFSSYLYYLKNGFYNITFNCISNEYLNSTRVSFQVRTDFEPRVQRGSQTISGVTSFVIPINLIDLSRSFLRFNSRTADSRPDRSQVLGFLNSTHLIFERYNGGADAFVEWEIVEHPEIYVQRGRLNYTTTNSTINIALNSSPIINSFPLISGRLNSATASDNVRGFFTSYLNSPTNLQLQRDVTGTSGEVSWQVVSSDYITVQQGLSSASLSGIYVNINPVELTETFLISSFRSTSTSAIDNMVQSRFINETQIVFRRGRDTGTTSVVYYIIHFPSSFVQRGDYRFSSSAPQNVSIEEINLSKSFNTLSYLYETDSTTYSNVYTTSHLSNSTNLRLQKYGPTGFVNSSWFVIQMDKFNLIKWVSILNGRTYANKTLDFNLSTYTPAQSCWFSLDNQPNQTMSVQNSTYFFYKAENLTDSTHNLIFYCNDSSGEIYQKGPIYFYVDTSQLSINIISPTQKTYQESYLDINITTNKAPNYCLYSLNNEQNFTMTNLSATFFVSNESYLREGNYILRVYCEDITGLIAYNSTNFAISIPAKLYVQKGRLTLPNTQSSVFYPVNVTDVSKAFLVFSSSTDQSQPSQIQILGELTKDGINFTRYSTSGDVIIDWEVVEHPDIYVQRGRQNYSATDSSIFQTFRAVNLSSSFPIISNRLSSTTTSDNPRGYWSVSFSNSTTIQAQRAQTGSLGEFSWQVVDWKNSFVQYGSVNSATTTATSNLANSVNLSKSFLIFSKRVSTGVNQDTVHVGGHFSAANQVRFFRRTATGTMYIDWFVVENNFFNTQRGFQYLSVSTPVYTPILPINNSRAFILNSFDSSGAGTTYANSQFSYRIYNSTTIEYQKATAVNNQNASWFVIELGFEPVVEFINIISPKENKYYNLSYLDFNISTYSNASACWFSLNYSSNQSMNQINSTYFYYNQTSLSEGLNNLIFYCNDTTGKTYSSNQINFTIDLTPPQVELINPQNNHQSSSNTINFTYNISDNFGIEKCSLLINGNIWAENYFVLNNSINYFDVYVPNGIFNWSIYCKDLAGNYNLTSNRTINVTGPETYSWDKRFYETSTFDVTGQTANIYLSNSRDSTENSVSINIPANSLSTIVSAISPYLGNDGVLIPSSTRIDFSGYFETTKPNVLYITWKIYYNNGSNPGDKLICMSGDDLTGGTRISSNSGTFTSYCNTSSYVWLKETDRLKLVINIYNADLTSSQLTHIWDGLRLSFVDFGNFSVLGKLSSELTYPESDISLNVGDEINVSCIVNCSAGTCYNTEVFIRQNTSSSNWSSISSSGNLILSQGQANPVNIGNLQGSQIVNFSIKANQESLNNIRCAVASLSDEYHGKVIRKVQVKGYPQIQFVSPTPLNNSDILTNYFLSNITIRDSNLQQFVFNLDGTNYTIDKNLLWLFYFGNSTDERIRTNFDYQTKTLDFPTINETIKLAYTFDNESIFGEYPSNIVRDYSIYGYDGTINYASYSNFGVVNKAMNFTPSGSYILVPYFGGISSKNQTTISFWAYQNNLSQGQYVIFGDGNLLIEFGSSEELQDSSSLRLRWHLNGTWANNHIVYNSLDSGSWNHWIFVFDNGNTSIYKNGFNIYNGTDINRQISSNSPSFYVGSYGEYKLNGLIDELVIYDRALNNNEISYLSKILPYKDPSKMWNFEINITKLPDGTHTYYAFAKNVHNNTNQTETRHINVDTTQTMPPYITIISPIEKTYNTSTIEFSVSLDKVGSWCGYSLNSGQNVTMTMINSTYFSINSSVSDGSHNVIFYCNSTFGLMGQSQTRYFSVDTSAPIMSYITPPTPQNNQIVYENYTSIKINISENSLRDFIFNWNGQNYSIYSPSLVLMMNLDNKTSLGENSTFVYDSSLYRNHGTFNGDASWNSSGRYGSSSSFDGTNDWIEIRDSDSLDGMAEFSFEAWLFDTSNDSQARAIASKRVDGTAERSWSIFTFSNRFVNFDIGSERHTSNVSLPSGRWVHLVVTFNGSAPTDQRKKFYYDGELVTTNSSAQTSIPSTTANLYIGILNANYGISWMGLIDEVKIYNRTLSPTEVRQNYMSNFYKYDLNKWTYFVNQTNLTDGDYNYLAYARDTLGFFSSLTSRIVRIRASSKGPKIILNLPLNQSYFNTSSINFNFTATDEFDSSFFCNLSVGNVRDTNFLVQNGTLTNRLVNAITDGNLIWNVSCINSANGSSESENRLITVQERPIVYLNTTNNSWFSEDVILRYTPIDNGELDNCSLYLNGELSRTESDPAKGILNEFLIYDLSQGKYDWNISCFDIYGNYNYSDTRVFYKDGQKPFINLILPEDFQEIYSSNIDFNFSVIDNMAENLTCNLTLDGKVIDQNILVANNTIVSRNHSVLSGTHFWNVTCSDFAGNTNTSQTRSFTNYLAPEVNLEEPQNNSWVNKTLLNLTYYLYDDDNNVANCSLYLNGELNRTNSTPLNNGNINYFEVNLSDGIYYWNVVCIDKTNLVGSGIQRKLNIDTIKPSINLINPSLGSIQTDNNITFAFNVSDNLAEVSICDIYINGFPEITSLSVQNSTNFSYFYLLNDGNYTWFVRCRDNASNQNTSSEYSFSVIAPPIINLTSPQNNFFTNNTTITFEYIPKDSIGLIMCSLYIDDNYITNSTTIFKNQPNYFYSISVGEGKHSWNVECTDSDLNVANSTKWNFSVDLTPPSIDLISPQNDSYLYAGLSSVSFTWVANDSLQDTLFCDLIVDGQVRASNVVVSSGYPITRQVSGLTYGPHFWNVSCWDSIPNRNHSITRKFNLDYPDFYINSSLIYSSSDSPLENEEINISAQIYNLGNVSFNNVEVKFYLGDPNNNGVQIGSTNLVNISSNSYSFASINWNISIGDSNIFVLADPSNKIIELNESNNKANRTFFVSSWHFFYGLFNANNQFVLESSISNSSILSWNKTDVSNSNLFITDYEAEINWLSLEPITINVLGNPSSNDIQEIDTLINSTNFSDSVSKIYLDENSQVKERSAFNVFGRILNNVPVANSINSSNFKTGILWDKSKDTNGEFDINDKENIVFISKVNMSSVGSNGEITDYEIRAPAKLRDYYTSDRRRAAFYVELS